MDVILAHVCDCEATLAKRAEDTVLAALLKTTTTPPPPPREQTKRH